MEYFHPLKKLPLPSFGAENQKWFAVSSENMREIDSGIVSYGIDFPFLIEHAITKIKLVAHTFSGNNC